MKEKIIAAIKAKFSAVNLSKKRLDAIAAVIEKKVIDDETRIDATLDAFNEYNPIADVAKFDDQQRNLEKQVKEAAKTTPPIKREETPAATATDDDTPTWAKALIEQNKTLQTDLAALKGEKIADSMKAKATEKLKDVPAAFWGKRPMPETDELLDAFVTEVKTDYAGFTKEYTDQGLGKMKTPPAASGTGGQAARVSADTQKFMESQKAKGVTGINISGPVPTTAAPAKV